MHSGCQLIGSLSIQNFCVKWSNQNDGREGMGGLREWNGSKRCGDAVSEMQGNAR